MWWWSEPGRSNFGDVLSPRLVKQLTRSRVSRSDSGSRLLAVGSILKWARRGDVVWGCGHAAAKHAAYTGADIRCVRGPVSEWLLRGHGVVAPPVYGDPALLLRVLYKPAKAERRYSLGLVPHYVDARLPHLQEAAEDEDTLVVDITGPLETVIEQIASCDAVASSSLHGVIAAEAYGIPAVWLELSDQVVGNGMKFRDYYESTERTVAPVNAEAKLPPREELVDMAAACIPAHVFRARLYDLMDSFPYVVEWPSVVDIDFPADMPPGWLGGQA